MLFGGLLSIEILVRVGISLNKNDEGRSINSLVETLTIRGNRQGEQQNIPRVVSYYGRLVCKGIEKGKEYYTGILGTYSRAVSLKGLMKCSKKIKAVYLEHRDILKCYELIFSI